MKRGWPSWHGWSPILLHVLGRRSPEATACCNRSSCSQHNSQFDYSRAIPREHQLTTISIVYDFVEFDRTIFQTLIAYFEEESLHRVHGRGFIGCGKEKGGIEMTEILLQEVPMFGGDL